MQVSARTATHTAAVTRVRVGVAFVAFTLAWFTFSDLRERMPRAAGEWIGIVLLDGGCCAIATFACWYVWHRNRDRFWAPLALAIAMFGVGDLLFDLSEQGILDIPDTATSPVNVLYLVAYAAMFVTTWRLVRRQMPPGAGPLLDTLIVAAGAAAALFPVIVEPYLSDGDGSLFVQTLSPVYPLFDLVLTAAFGVALASSGRIPALRVLGASAAVCLVADHALITQLNAGTYHLGSWVDWMYPLQYVLMAMAVTFPLDQADDHQDERGDRWRFAPIVISAVVCPALLVGTSFVVPQEHRQRIELMYATASFVLVLLVCARLVHVLSAHASTVRRLSAALAERERLTADLEHQSTHDAVTGLPNRYDLARRAEILLAGSSGEHAVVYLDVDDFKKVNDTYGHTVGDGALADIADRLRRMSRPTDVVARLGGDEFAVLMQDCTPAVALVIARRMVEAVSRPLIVDGAQVGLSASAGIAGMSADGSGYADALTHADLAMYSAKRAGKNRVLVYTETMRHDVLGDAELASDLVTALREGQLEPAFQPVLDLRSGVVHSLESLARWRHPVRGEVMPGEFIPVAIARNLSAELDLQMMAKSIAHVAVWRRTHPHLRVGVNTTAATLALPDLPARVLALLEQHGLGGDALILEVTEQAVLAEPVGVAERLEELRDAGVLIALDDFGTGYSSLSYLTDLPIDNLKLDRSFLSTGTDGSAVSPLLRSVVRLGHELGMTVLAEGIETSQQLHIVNRLGCEYGQGWLFSRAVPADAVPALLSGPVPLPRGASDLSPILTPPHAVPPPSRQRR